MHIPSRVPESTVTRLSLYRRELDRLAESGRLYVSSFELADKLSVGAAQIRRDLHYFGQFGKAGRGYQVIQLRGVLSNLLGVGNRVWRTCLVGVGNLGRALLTYPGFTQQGFRIVCAFDEDPEKIGRRVNGLVVEPAARLEERLRRDPVQIGMIAVPAPAAQEVGERLCRAGVRAILNFSSTSIQTPPSVRLRHVDLSMELERLSFHLSRRRPKAHG